MSQLDNEKPMRQRLDALSTLVKSLDEQDEALQDLSGKSNPEAIRQTIVILNDKECYQEAAEFVKAQQFHSKWCDLAVRVLSRNGDLEKAKEYVGKAKELADSNTWHRCCLQYAFTIHDEIISDIEKYGFSLPDSKKTHAAEDALVILEPILNFVYGKNKVETQLEAFAVEIVINLNRFLGKLLEIKKLAKLLNSRSPVSYVLVNLILSGEIEDASGIPERIRNDYPDSINLLIQASLIESRFFDDTKNSLNKIRELLLMANTDSDKGEVCNALFEISNRAGLEEMECSLRLAIQIIGKDHFLVKLFEAGCFLEKEEPNKALKILEEIGNEDNPLYLQMYANYYLRVRDEKNAILTLEKLSEYSPSLDSLLMLSNLAYLHEKKDVSEKALIRALQLYPSNIPCRRNLISIYFDTDDYFKASEHLNYLHEKNEASKDELFNLALCYVRIGEPHKANSLIESLSDNDVVPIHVFLLRAKTLLMIGKEHDAFVTLDSVKEKFWDNVDFLLEYMSIGYSASEEDASHKAMVQLQELKKKGKVEDNLFRSVSMDDLKEHAIQFQDRRNTICENILVGKMPWVLGCELLNETPYWGWFLKTQLFKWSNDKNVDRAYYSIYSTNGFTTLSSDDGRIALEKLTEIPLGSKVVIDLSSLITLNELDLLEKASLFFSEIKYPSLYLEKIVEDTVRLYPHQQSHLSALKNIKKAIDNRAIKVISKDDNKDDFVYVDEYNIWDMDSIGLADIVKALANEGLLSSNDKVKMQSLSHRPITDGLVVSEMICFELSTLRTIASNDLLDALVHRFDVYLSIDGKEEVLSNLSGYEIQNEIQDRNNKLWSIIKNNKKFVHDGVDVLEKTDGHGKKHSQDVGISSAILSEKKNLPLVSDDRVLQVIRLNSKSVTNTLVVDTYRLLESMEESKLITKRELADAYLKLIRWRYRFIIPSVSILKELLLPYIDNSPGKDLQDVAIYLHECMRDPGLFSGAENVDPPVSMAFRLYQSWVSLISDFVMSIWMDEDISESAALSVTQWVGEEFYPSTPEIVDMNMQIRLAEQTARTAISFALISTGQSRNKERMNRGLCSLAEALNVTSDEYLTYVMAVIDD